MLVADWGYHLPGFVREYFVRDKEKAMSPTLLEIVIAVVLLVVIWQIGVTVAPIVFSWFRNLSRSVDDAAETIEEHKRSDQFSQSQSRSSSYSKEHHNGKER